MFPVNIWSYAFGTGLSAKAKINHEESFSNCGTTQRLGISLHQQLEEVKVWGLYEEERIQLGWWQMAENRESCWVEGRRVRLRWGFLDWYDDLWGKGRKLWAPCWKKTLTNIKTKTLTKTLIKTLTKTKILMSFEEKGNCCTGRRHQDR